MQVVRTVRVVAERPGQPLANPAPATPPRRSIPPAAEVVPEPLEDRDNAEEFLEYLDEGLAFVRDGDGASLLRFLLLSLALILGWLAFMELRR